MPKKWLVDLKEFKGLLDSDFPNIQKRIAVSLLAIAERLERLVHLLGPTAEEDLKIGGTDPD